MLAQRIGDFEGNQAMSDVVDFPVQQRAPRVVRNEPAEVVAHPRSVVDTMADAIDKLERCDAADRAMAEMHREIEIVALKLAAIARAHGRQIQAITLMEMAAERVRTELAS